MSKEMPKPKASIRMIGPSDREGQPDRIAQKFDRLAPRIGPEPRGIEAFGRRAALGAPSARRPRRAQSTAFSTVDAGGVGEIADESLLERRAARSLTRSCGAPTASTLPACISEMRSQRSASFMKWVVRKIVTPSSRERSISVRQNASRAIGSTPDVGSSRMSMGGSCSTATASCSRCFIPSGRLSGLASATAFRS